MILIDLNEIKFFIRPLFEQAYNKTYKLFNNNDKIKHINILKETAILNKYMYLHTCKYKYFLHLRRHEPRYPSDVRHKLRTAHHQRSSSVLCRGEQTFL